MSILDDFLIAEVCFDALLVIVFAWVMRRDVDDEAKTQKQQLLKVEMRRAAREKGCADGCP